MIRRASPMVGFFQSCRRLGLHERKLMLVWNTERTVALNGNERCESPSWRANQTVRLNVKSYRGCSRRKRATIG